MEPSPFLVEPTTRLSGSLAKEDAVWAALASAEGADVRALATEGTLLARSPLLTSLAPAPAQDEFSDADCQSARHSRTTNTERSKTECSEQTSKATTGVHRFFFWSCWLDFLVLLARWPCLSESDCRQQSH